MINFLLHPTSYLYNKFRICSFIFLFSIAMPSYGADLLDYDYDYQNINYLSTDNETILSGNVYLPKEQHSNELFPTVIFINSWGMGENEYIKQAKRLAKKGYIVLSYSSRGWGDSSGYVNGAGPEDIMDLQATIDWLDNNTRIDSENLGVAGISYGGGISLLGLSQLDSIKTAVSMSGWSNLLDTFYAQNTPRTVWGGILLTSGYLTGNMDPLFLYHYNNLKNHLHLDEVEAWTKPRSATTFIEQLNEREDASVYISHNWNDELFQPNQILDYFSKLTIKKRMDINKGIHATAELGGLFFNSNEVWDNVIEWFDEELKNIPTTAKPQVTMAVNNKNSRDEFESWPSSNISLREFYTNSRGIVFSGTLREYPNIDANRDSIDNGVVKGVTAGIPVIGPLFEANFGIPVLSWLPGINRLTTIQYSTDWLDEKVKIRGTPKVHVTFKPSEERTMLVAYLFDVDLTGTGRLITHGPASFIDVPYQQTQKAVFEMISVAYDVPKGHYLALIFTTQETAYGQPSNNRYRMTFEYMSPDDAKLSLPVYNN